MEPELSTFIQQLKLDVENRAEAFDDWQESAFFDLVAEEVCASAEVETVDRVHWRSARGDAAVDGYGGDPTESDGVLSLMIVEHDPERAGESLNKADLQRLMSRLRTFLERSLTSKFRGSLEESSQVFGLADLIHATWPEVSKVRLILMTSR